MQTQREHLMSNSVSSMEENWSSKVLYMTIYMYSKTRARNYMEDKSQWHADCNQN